MELVTKYEMAPFSALINMIKINYFEKAEVYKTLLAVLNDFNPDNANSKERTEHYIQLLLKNDKELADCLITFLPESVNSEENLKPEPIRLHIKTKKKKKKKHKKYYSMRQTSSLKDSVFTTSSSHDADHDVSLLPHESNHAAFNQETLPTKTVNTTILDPTTFQAVKKEIKPCPVNCTSPHSTHTYNITPTTSKTMAPICAVVPARAPSTSTQGLVYASNISVPLPLIAPDQDQNRTIPVESAVTLLPQLTPTSTPVENARTLYQTAPIESPTVLSCSDNSGNIMTREQLSQSLSKAPEFPCFIFNQQHAYKSPLPQTIPCYSNIATSTRDHQLIVNNDIPVKLANPKSFSQPYQDAQGYLPSSLHCPDVVSMVSEDNLYSGTSLPTIRATNEGYRQQNAVNVQQHVPLPEAPRDINAVPLVQWTARYDHQSSMKHCQPLPVQAIEMNTKVAPFQSLPPSMPHSVSQVVPQLLPPKPLQHAVAQAVNQQTYHIPSVYLGTASNLSSFPYTRQIIIPENPNFYLKKLPSSKLETPLNLVANKNKASSAFQTDSKNMLGLTKCPNSVDDPSQVITRTTEQKFNDVKNIQYENNTLPFIIGHNPSNKLPLEETFSVNDNMDMDTAAIGDLETPCVSTKASKPRKLTMTPNQGVRKKLRLIPYKQSTKENNELQLL